MISLSSLVFGVAIIFFAGCRADRGARVVRISAASSMTESITALARAWEKRHPGVRVMVNAAGSSTLARQILSGAPADIFVSADPIQMDRVAAAGLVSERRALLTNRLVLISGRSGDAAGLVAVGDDAVPAGAYARKYIAAARPDFADRLVSFANVRQVLAAVVSGNAAFGFVYETDARLAGGAVRIVARAPIADSGPIVYPIALLRNASAEAAQFA